MRRHIKDEVIKRLAMAACASASCLSRESEYVKRRWPSFKAIATAIYDEIILIDSETLTVEENEDEQPDRTA